MGNRKHWVPLFEKYREPVVLEHHDHTFKRTKPLVGGLPDDNGVLFLGDAVCPSRPLIGHSLRPCRLALTSPVSERCRTEGDGS